MKNINLLILGLMTSISFMGCSPEEDITNPNFIPQVFAEDFSPGGVDNTILDTKGWINIAQTGTVKWKEQIFSNNVYAEFSSFQSPDLVSVGWLISPKINLDKQEGEKLIFQSSQSFVSSGSNSLEVFYSKDFDGTNVSTATWIPIEAILPSPSSTYFEFIDSGVIDLSNVKGEIQLAFKVTGSGSNTALDGSYQIDNISIYN